jgi:hypothetical protein
MDKMEAYELLKKRGQLEYGSVISLDYFREVFNIYVPEVGTHDEFKKAALEELSASDWIRGRLISEGKYFKSNPTGYRVLLPSENEGQIMAYVKSADSKLKRALRLQKNTPKENIKKCNSARIKAKIDSAKDYARKSKFME